MDALKLMLGILVLTVITGCNTMEGVGKDIQQGGEAIEKSAK